jgi:hypothetical protein
MLFHQYQYTGDTDKSAGDERPPKETASPIHTVVYRFVKGEKVDLNDATKIMGFTTQSFFPLVYEGGKVKYTYVVTALDRLHNESKPKKEKIKL